MKYILGLHFSDDSYETKLEGAYPLGCWKLTDQPLEGNFKYRSDAVQKCFAAARKKIYGAVAVSNGGSCQVTSPHRLDIIELMKNGRSTKCAKDGKGGPDASQIYGLMSK